MASILGRHSLTQKDMPEMTTTILTDDLGTAAICIGMAFDGIRNFIIETGPSTVTFKFVMRVIKGCITSPTNERAGIFQVRIFTTERRFGSLVDKNM